MKHPFDRLPGKGGRFALFMASVVIASCYWYFLVNSKDILPLTFAGSGDGVNSVVKDWNGPVDRGSATRSLLWDFGLIFLYVANFTYACKWAGEMFASVKWSKLSRFAKALTKGQVFAGCLDAFENGCLLYILARLKVGLPITQPSPALAAIAAGAKFLLLGGGLLLSAAGVVAWLCLARANRSSGKVSPPSD